MRHLMSPLDFSVEELDQLLNLAADIEKHPAKYAHACDGKKTDLKVPDPGDLAEETALPFPLLFSVFSAFLLLAEVLY